MAMTEQQLPKPKKKFSWLEGYVLRHAHPRSMLVDSIGWLWFLYYFWDHEWEKALVVLVAATFISFIVALGTDLQALAETTLGKIALLHLHPFNVFFQLVGIGVLLWGVWHYSGMVTMLGLTLILVGHLNAWSTVDRRFKSFGEE